jgi:hypothetical protein
VKDRHHDVSGPASVDPLGGSSRGMYSNTASSPGRQMKGILLEGFLRRLDRASARPWALGAKTVRLAMRRCKVGRSGVSASASAAGHYGRRVGSWAISASALPCPARRISASSRDRAPTRTTLTGPASSTLFYCAAPRSRRPGHHRHRCRQDGAPRCCGLHRRRSASGWPPLRLARYLEGRHGRTTASAARPGQGSPCG